MTSIDTNPLAFSVVLYESPGMGLQFFRSIVGHTLEIDGKLCRVESVDYHGAGGHTQITVHLQRLSRGEAVRE